MASRFVEADEEFIEELKNTSENKNTKRSKHYLTRAVKVCQNKQITGKNSDKKE